MKKLILFLSLTLFVFNCERDDICTTDSITTPRLTIAFYDIEMPQDQNPKNVFRIRVQGIGNEETLPGMDGSSDRAEGL